VCQVGHLPELYEDPRSEKHKIEIPIHQTPILFAEALHTSCFVTSTVTKQRNAGLERSLSLYENKSCLDTQSLVHLINIIKQKVFVFRMMERKKKLTYTHGKGKEGVPGNYEKINYIVVNHIN